MMIISSWFQTWTSHLQPRQKDRIAKHSNIKKKRMVLIYHWQLKYKQSRRSNREAIFMWTTKLMLVLSALICWCTGTAFICLQFVFIAPTIQSWTPSIKVLHPLRLIVGPVCFMRWPAHPECLRGLFTVSTHKFKVCDPHRGEVLVEEPVIFGLTDSRLFGFY